MANKRALLDNINTRFAQCHIRFKSYKFNIWISCKTHLVNARLFATIRKSRHTRIREKTYLSNLKIHLLEVTNSFEQRFARQ